MAANSAGGSRLPVPVKRGDVWVVLGTTANRLWDRGCFGRPIRDGVQLTTAEVLCAHRLRGLPIPHEQWLSDALVECPDLLLESEILGALRFPGEKVVLAENLSAANAVLLDPRSWALRWSRNVMPKEAPPLAEIRWVKASDTIDWKELQEWTSNVESGGRIAELLIIDDEHSVVTYRSKFHQPKGTLSNPFRELDNEQRRSIAHAWSDSRETSEGTWLDIDPGNWHVNGIGIRLEGGIWLTEIEGRIVSRIINPTMPNPSGKLGQMVELLADLLSKGVAIRSGFKYGTRWRAYAGAVGGEHAPWLIVPVEEAPTNWGEACLSARLAANVNKLWLCASVTESKEWRYLAIERPPSDSRWTNPVKH